MRTFRRTVSSGSSFCVVDPATGDAIGSAPDLGSNEVLQALDRAAAAQRRWELVAATDRAALLDRWYDRILQHRATLAGLMVAESGKPLREALAEVDYAASFVRWFAEEARRLDGEMLAASSLAERTYVDRVPVGVVAAITPWNFPAAMVTRKVAPALAAGCAVVLKPSELTPLTAVALSDLLKEAGGEDGLLQPVSGLDSAMFGEVLTSSPIVAKISFTGSTTVGRLLASKSAAGLKRLSLELGGNAPFIVFSDVDLDDAIASLMIAKFRNSGQTCVAANRILIQDSVHDVFVARLTEAINDLSIGPGRDDRDLGSVPVSGSEGIPAWARL